MIESAALKDFRSLKRTLADRYLRPSRTGIAAFAATSPTPRHNVVGVGIGEKIVAGQPTGVLALKFFVRVKYTEREIAPRDRLPKFVDGLPVDVEEVRNFRKLAARRRRRRRISAMPNPRTRFRPAQPGCSVGFRYPGDQYVMAGTFGALVRDARGARYVLSNNHVLADENQLALGSPIFQPGLLDGGKPGSDAIAKLSRFIPMKAARINRVDAAIARLDRTTLAIPDILQIGRPRGKTKARIDMVVHKFGRTTSYTVGRVTSTDTDVSVDYDTGTFRFNDQLIVVGTGGTSFSDSGDSGSSILERASGKVVGLLFAGSATHTIANPIDTVLSALKVRLV